MNNGSLLRNEGWMLAATLVLLSLLSIGCGGTCKRIEADRNQFVTRKGDDKGTDLEMVIPFGVAEHLVQPYVTTVKPIEISLSGLGGIGNLVDYLGELTIVPTKVELLPATLEHIGFHLDFEIQRNGERVFDMYVETEVKPEVDLAGRKIVIGFSPESLEKAKPGLSPGAKADLSEMIYTQIPGPARLFIPRGLVDGFAESAVDMIVEKFFDRAKQKMLPKLSEMSRLEIALPNAPISQVSFRSTAANSGHLWLAITTSLPVQGVLSDPKGRAAKPSRSNVTLRMSGSTAAELVNWAMDKELVPNRYDDKGKPQKDGVYRPGLDWMNGNKRPMKIYLWDLEKPCMKITMSATPTVAVVGDNLEINAEDVETDDVDASAFTKVGTWFYLLWKDAMNIHKKSSSKIHMVAAGREIEAVAKKAALEKDELVLEVALTVKDKSK
jgi:hypothetical protein